MILYAVAGISLCVVLYSAATKKSLVISLRKLIPPLVYTVFILCLMIFSRTAVNAAYKGLRLWLDIVFPSLFPFLVVSHLLSKTSFIRRLGRVLEPLMRPLFNIPGCGSFALAMGIVSGYPVGAKIVADMRKDGFLTKNEAERLLAFSNNSGPLFIVGAVSTGMFNMPEIGMLLLLCHIAACITVGVVFSIFSRKKKPNSNNNYRFQTTVGMKRKPVSTQAQINSSFSVSLGKAVSDSIMSMLIIGGFIILFSVIISMLKDTGVILAVSDILASFMSPLGIDRYIIASVISGIFEITSGVNMASGAISAGFVQQLPAASFIIGWAGLSVHSQVLTIVSETDISVKPYLIGKLLQGSLAMVYTIVGIKAAGSLLEKAKPAFWPSYIYETLNWQSCLYQSCKYLLALMGLFFAVMLISKLDVSIKQKVLKHKKRLF